MIRKELFLLFFWITSLLGFIFLLISYREKIWIKNLINYHLMKLFWIRWLATQLSNSHTKLLYRICYRIIIRWSNIVLCCYFQIHKSVFTFRLLISSVVMLVIMPLHIASIINHWELSPIFLFLVFRSEIIF